MTQQWILNIVPSISEARLQRYNADPAQRFDAMVNYFWNMALAESLYSPIGIVEIALRNSLHTTLTSQFGTPNWYKGTGLLEPAQRADLALVERRIRDSGRDVTADRVVSELSFGFWVTILSRNYDARLWNRSNYSALRSAFPRVPRKQRQRVSIHRRYNAIRLLRNRTFHHEPLFDDPQLSRRFTEIIESIRWINPDLLVLTGLFDRFDLVWNDGRSLIERELSHLG